MKRTIHTIQPIAGDWLATVGLPLPLMKAETIAIFSIGKI